MKIGNFLKFIVIAVYVLIFIACEDKENLVDNNYAIVSVVADVSEDNKTTKLTITVNDDKIPLTAEDIIINATFSVIKGELKKVKDTARTYELAITPGNTGTIRVGLNPYNGFTGWNAKPVKVYADWLFNEDSELKGLKVTGKNIIEGTSLVIPKSIANKTVKAIGYRAFYEKNLTEIEIPESVTSIGDSAFASNELKEIIIPESVVSIGSTAFAYNELEEVTIPDNVKSIAYGTFAYNQLSDVTIPASVIDIQNYAFAYNKLAEITILDGVKSIGEYAFTDNLLEDDKVTIPDSVTTIGNGAFSYNQLTSLPFSATTNISSLSGFNNNKLTDIKIPESVTVIGPNAFANNNISGITIPEKVTTISTNAFANNNISEIVIPDSVTIIDFHAFIGNPLTKIEIGENVTLYSYSFSNRFEYYYYDNGRKKGKYEFTGSEWSYTPPASTP